ncbi:MAG: DUF1653 domain-containing protein [archaeon]
MEEKEITIGAKCFNYKHPEKFYEIIGVAKHSETLEDLVLYKALYESDFSYGQIWARPKKMFLEKIVKEGKEISRFTLVK